MPAPAQRGLHRGFVLGLLEAEALRRWEEAVAQVAALVEACLRARPEVAPGLPAVEVAAAASWAEQDARPPRSADMERVVVKQEEPVGPSAPVAVADTSQAVDTRQRVGVRAQPYPGAGAPGAADIRYLTARVITSVGGSNSNHSRNAAAACETRISCPSTTGHPMDRAACINAVGCRSLR